MTGCKFNATNGCAKCPARQPCELPLEAAESSYLGAYQANHERDLVPAVAAIVVVVLSGLAFLYLAGVLQ